MEFSLVIPTQSGAACYDKNGLYKTEDIKIDINNIKDFEVSDWCIQVHPCHHPTTLYFKEPVMVDEMISEYKSDYINGRYIYRLHVHLNREVPTHFQHYKNDYEEACISVKRYIVETELSNDNIMTIAANSFPINDTTS